MKKRFINIKTGEVICRLTRRGAYRYFKRDGKRCGYSVQWYEIISQKEMENLVAMGVFKAWVKYVLANEPADGNA